MTICIFLFVWIIFGFFAYGINYGHFRNRFTTLNDKHEIDQMVSFATLFFFLGPIGFFVAIFASGFATYGLRWRR